MTLVGRLSEPATADMREELTMKRVVLAATLLSLVLLTTAHAGDLQAGIEAYQRGDYATAFREWRPLAEQGDALAQFLLGSMYDQGEGRPKDKAEAVKWFRKAAEQGFAEAQFNLGNMYLKGEGRPKDKAEAVKWYRKAAEQGHAKAQNALGVACVQGECVPKDKAEAEKWFRKAAEQGFAQAQFNLRRMYDRGDGVPKDGAEAEKWYRKAAEQGLAEAQNALDVIRAEARDFQAGREAYDRGDFDTALREWRPLAEQGIASAQYNLGTMYLKGEGVPQSDAEAAKWYRKAAEQGDTKAQMSLGVLYLESKEVPQDYVKGYAWIDIGLKHNPSNGAMETNARRILEGLDQKMSLSQRVRAQGLSRLYWMEYVVPFLKQRNPSLYQLLNPDS